jgi:hypothetical protein
MASQNNLIFGSAIENVVAPEPKKYIGWLYHKDCLEGRLIAKQDEYDRLKAQGWVQNIREARNTSLNIEQINEQIAFDDEVTPLEDANIVEIIEADLIDIKPAVPINEDKAVILEAEIKKKHRGRPAKKI